MGLVLALSLCGPAHAEKDWHVLLYTGQFSTESFADVLWKDWDLQDEYLAAVAVGKEIVRYPKILGVNADLGVELEGIVAQHWGDGEEYQEFDGSINTRWHHFPWNKYIKTSIGLGGGISYTTSVPDHEAQRWDGSNQWLVFLMYDFTFGLPAYPEWSVFFRVHHRSGAFGTFDGVHGASNYPCVGIRYEF